MRVGIDISQIVYRTGVSDYTINLVSELLKLDQSDQFVLFGSSLRKKSLITSQFPQAKTFSLPPTALHYLWNKFHICNIENFTGPIDFFHSSDWAEPPASCPKVTTIHDLSPLLFPSEMASGGMTNLTSVHRARLHWVAAESAKVICVSQSTAKDTQKLFHIPQEKIVVIPEALPARFDHDPDQNIHQLLTAKYQLQDYIIAVGTQQPRKNLLKLISAYRHFKKQYRLPGKLVVVGGSGWGSLMTENYSDVVFTGYLPDMELIALLAGAQVFVYPSLYEGFGLPILNAFRQSVPVVTSDVSSLPEVAGNAATLVDPNSEEDIAAGIAKAINSKTKLISAGHIQLRKYSWADTAQKTLSVYKSLC